MALPPRRAYALAFAIGFALLFAATLRRVGLPIWAAAPLGVVLGALAGTWLEGFRAAWKSRGLAGPWNDRRPASGRERASGSDDADG
jgi:hypothetical protein